MEKELIKNEEVSQAVALKEQVAQEQAGLSINTKNADIIKDSLEKLNLIADTIKQALIPNLDYGIIPGVQKPSLFKPGAEKIALMYGLTQEYQMIESVRDRENDIILYKFKAILVNENGRQIAEGFGLCSSQEKKYIKQNPYDIENTIMKMAKKRALVDAAISIGVLSKVFTQDVEDYQVGLQAPVLGKWERLGIYTTIYEIFAEYKPNFKNNDDFKDAVKSIIPSMITNAKISTRSLMEFTSADKKQLLEYINDPNNFKNEEARFKEKFKIK